MSENNFWHQLRNGIYHKGHFSRIESHATSNGFPDIDFCTLGISGQIELKYTNSMTAPEIRPSQVRWFKKRTKHDGNAWLFVKVEVDKTFYLLIPQDRVVEVASQSHIMDWFKYSIHIWEGQMNWDDFLDTIRTYQLWGRTPSP